MRNFVLTFVSALFCLSACTEKTSDDVEVTRPSKKYEEKPYTVKIFSRNKMQKVTHWGHDIKQDGKAINMNPEAARQIFQNSNWNLLRVPIYPNAHNADGTIKEDYYVRLADNAVPDEAMKWELVPAEGEWFHLRNVFFDKYIRAFPPGDGLGFASTMELDEKVHTGSWTQFRLVDAGGGWYHIECRGYDNKHIRGTDADDIGLADTDNQTASTKWKVIESEDDFVYLHRRGTDKYLKGGGSQYDVVIKAINIAKDNGKPDLFASPKIWDNSDLSTDRNINFGHFYTSEGIDTKGFAACLDAFIDFVHDETGETVKYLAPRCELGRHWTPEAFVAVVNNLKHQPSIVGPEAAYAKNSESFYTPEVEQVTDIKSTHNKEHAPLWPGDGVYDWDGETVGGSKDKFFTLVFKLHEAFYKGEVTGIVFWGDKHLTTSPPDGNSNGPFRRELVAAAVYNLVECEKLNDPVRSVIAFETDQPDEVKVFYCSLDKIEFKFDRPLQLNSIPKTAFNITERAFEMKPTGEMGYGSFRIKFLE